MDMGTGADCGARDLAGHSAAVTVEEIRARHPNRVIRREGFKWVATDPKGIMPPLDSVRLDFLDALLDETGEAR